MLQPFFLLVSFCCLLFVNNLPAQPIESPFDLHPPLNGDLHLSGSFGEIRTSSFHAGLDFRTGGRTGLKVFASESGYVSRVRVGGMGYGKALYINHSNGLTTVYGHLDRFSSQIEELVKEHQYRNQSFEIDMHLAPQEIRVNRGELIGLSGNTGSSGGPHLHYEVRRTKNQIPLNAAYSNLPIIDTLPPVISGLWIYPIDSTTLINDINTITEINVQTRNGDYYVADTISFWGEIGLGLKAYDYINSSSLRCGVYSIEMLVNGKTHYSFILDEFSFNETRYANSHIDFAFRQLDGKRIHRLYKEPNNHFRGYKSLVNEGKIVAQQDSIYNVIIIVKDPYQNTSQLNMLLTGKESFPEISIPNYSEKLNNQVFWLFYKDNSISKEEFSISVPKNSLYNNITFTFGISDPPPNSYSSLIQVHNRFTALHRNYELSIRADSVPNHLKDKTLILSLNHEGEIEAAGGAYTEEFVTTNINYFGDFFISVDTIPPTIIPINIADGKDMSKEKSIRFNVDDELSGIATINGYINGNWVLFEHDPKNQLVFYEFDNKRLAKGKSHELILVATDHKGNTNEYSITFYW